jgi:hypothetical protein
VKPSEIKAGKTYRNRGAGQTARKVVDIGNHIGVTWFGSGPPPDEPGVRYIQSGRFGAYANTLFISAFARWAGSVVE